MKRPLLLLPLLALASGCHSSNSEETRAIANELPDWVRRSFTVTNRVEDGDSGDLSCRIVDVRYNGARVQFLNRTGGPVLLDTEQRGGFAPAFLSMRAYDGEGRICSTNANGASRDGFWSPSMLRSDQIRTDAESEQPRPNLRVVPSGEGIEGVVEVSAFFGSVAPALRIAAIEPAATVRLPSGEWRTVVGPRTDFSVEERDGIRSFTDWFRNETGREASGLILFFMAAPSERLQNDPDYKSLEVFLAPSAAGVEKLTIRSAPYWVVDPTSPQAAQIVAVMRRYRDLSWSKIQPLGNHLALLVWDPDGDGWSADGIYPWKSYRDFLCEVRDILASAANAPPAPSPAEETRAESAENAESEPHAEGAE